MDKKDIRRANMQILQQALMDLGQATKPQLAEASGFSVVTVNALLKELVEAGVAETVEAARSGDKDAVEKLYRLYRDRIWFFVRKNVASKPAAEDIVSDTFLTAIEKLPELRFDILEEVSKRLPGFPIVLHGSSSVPQWAVKQINEYGGKLDNTAGIPEGGGIRG